MASLEKYTILYGRLSQEDMQKTNKNDDSNSIQNQRMLFGRTTANRVSRFVSEIPEEHIFTVIVTVQSRMWNVIVIGIITPPFGDVTEPHKQKPTQSFLL